MMNKIFFLFMVVLLLADFTIVHGEHDDSQPKQQQQPKPTTVTRRRGLRGEARIRTTTTGKDTNSILSNLFDVFRIKEESSNNSGRNLQQLFLQYHDQFLWPTEGDDSDEDIEETLSFPTPAPSLAPTAEEVPELPDWARISLFN